MIKGKTTFTLQEIKNIEELIEEKLKSSSDKQKQIRDKIRKKGFYWRDFHPSDNVEYNVENFKNLISGGYIEIKDSEALEQSDGNNSRNTENTTKDNKELCNCRCFDALIDEDSEILVLGTMPGKKSLESGEYYANAKNCFWKIISDVFNDGKNFKDYKEKCDCLKKHHIALWDVLASCEREGSLDENIADEVPNDIVGLLKQYHKIKKIIFNGQEPKEMFKQEEVTCDCLVAPSTSSANTNMTYDEKLKYWKGLLSPEKTK